MPSELIASIEPLRRRIADARRTRGVIGLVPTMGALHAGHARLIEEARRECATVVVSIFVNPLQFDREDDLRRYPRTLDADRALCDRLGVDLIFAPAVEAMYPRPPELTIDVGRLADHLCGPARPGHFKSVATVVMKLLCIVAPDRAYFGEKDAQQLRIVRRMVADFNVPTVIVGIATVRDDDGLALSSRNQHLTPAERQLAPALYRALQIADNEIGRGDTDPASVKRAALAAIPADPSLRVEYFDIVDPDNLQPVEKIDARVLVAGAMWVGTTRLIDNIVSAPAHTRT